MFVCFFGGFLFVWFLFCFVVFTEIQCYLNVLNTELDTDMSPFGSFSIHISPQKALLTSTKQWLFLVMMTKWYMDPLLRDAHWMDGSMIARVCGCKMDKNKTCFINSEKYLIRISWIYLYVCMNISGNFCCWKFATQASCPQKLKHSTFYWQFKNDLSYFKLLFKMQCITKCLLPSTLQTLLLLTVNEIYF